MEACCTCARLLSAVPAYAEKSEKPLPRERRLECCRRVICGDCLHKNTRFATYCPYCQTSSASSLLPQGPKEPPSYTTVATNPSASLLLSSDTPPPYTPEAHTPTRAFSPPTYHTTWSSEKTPITPPPEPELEPTLHFLNHDRDTILSLSLRYNIPASQLRSLNRLTSDHLLAARRTLLIPGTSPSLSPRPVEGEEEEIRKSKIRRWMVTTKIADYDVAVLYMEQNGYDLSLAVENFFADEAWEREHPLPDGNSGKARKGKGLLKRAGGTGGVWASQAAFLRRRGSGSGG